MTKDRFRKFSRAPGPRRAMLRQLVEQIVQHEQIHTTLAKGKEIRRFVDRSITLAKRNTLVARRKMRKYFYTRESFYKLIDNIAPRFANRQGGYLRVLPTRKRKGDSAQLCVVEFVDIDNSILTPAQLSARVQRKEARLAWFNDPLCNEGLRAALKPSATSPGIIRQTEIKSE